MARKPTIYRFAVTLSDIDASRYQDLNLTVALHPSETLERMMARLLAYCLNADEGLTFSKGLSEADEPDIWQHSLDGRILNWIEVGEPSAERLRKACGLAEQVQVYAFNTKAGHWWTQQGKDLERLGIRTVRLDWDALVVLGKMASRTMALSVTVSGESAYVAADAGTVEVGWQTLSPA